MGMMPFQILGAWFRALLAVALLAAGITLLALWYNNRLVEVHETVEVPRADAQMGEPDRVAPDASGSPARTTTEERVRIVPWQFGLNKPTAYLLSGLALLAWSFGGWTLPVMLHRHRGDHPPRELKGTPRRVRSADGTELHAEVFGPEDAPVIVMTHGWGLDAEEWCYARKELGTRFHLILWDLPGLGRSGNPHSRNWSLEQMARDLDAVIGLAGGRPVVLLGHSIGGMITLTYCKLFPEALGTRVRGIVIAQSTYTNPVMTAKYAEVYAAIQKPVLEPLCHLMIWTSPVVWVMNVLSYLNGSAHRSTERSVFSGKETWNQLDYIARYYLQSSPGVMAHGYLGMFRYDATAVLPTVRVPALIVAGDRDSSCTPEASQHMARTIPDARLVILPESEHGGLFEHHAAFHTAVGEFATACLGGRAADAPSVPPAEVHA